MRNQRDALWLRSDRGCVISLGGKAYAAIKAAFELCGLYQVTAAAVVCDDDDDD